MPYTPKQRDEHLANDNLPKRILSLDGGGLKGILTLGILQKIEDVLRERHGQAQAFRLSHYFDLIAGTSTGAIIAAGLAIGMSVEELRGKYMELGQRVFEKSFFRKGVLRAKYDHKKLDTELKGVYGAETSMGSDTVQTGLLIMTKRLDTGSPWPISNNPRGKYYGSRPGGTIGNSEYPLWQVVRSSTAAPAYFDPETITIVEKTDHKPVRGEFVDGGVSPFNNPALQAVMYATMDGYRIGWDTGTERLLLVSVGTGRPDPAVKKQGITAAHAVTALVSLMDDCAALQETMLQWMSSSRTARTIDRELGDLRHDLVAKAPLMTYLRYNADLSREGVHQIFPDLTDNEKIESLSAMDDPDNMPLLHDLGKAAGERDVQESDFPSTFDLV